MSVCDTLLKYTPQYLLRSLELFLKPLKKKKSLKTTRMIWINLKLIKKLTSPILAEVEREVNEESFQNNFYQFIKKRVSDIAVAFANRNN